MSRWLMQMPFGFAKPRAFGRSGSRSSNNATFVSNPVRVISGDRAGGEPSGLGRFSKFLEQALIDCINEPGDKKDVNELLMMAIELQGLSSDEVRRRNR